MNKTMNKRLAPAVVELTQDALLKAFWHKRPLRLFLLQHGIGDRILAQWHVDQSKRDFVEWLWPELVKTDTGHEAILRMARSLAEMQHFPDLERREDTKIRIAEAQQAVARLKEMVQRINETVRETEEARQRRQVAQEDMLRRLSAQQSVEKLQTLLQDLMPQLGTQNGGYAFERWFYDLAVFYELDARPRYTANGREIDGAITTEGTTFLVETKFTKVPIESPDVDTFMAKIESKADNTMGLLVSIAGFTDGAKHTASRHRTPMLLLDHSHIFGLILRGVMTLPEVVARVKRHASQTGSSYLGASEF